MKFLVTRTSVWDKTQPPCEGAVSLSPEPSFWDGKWEVEINSIDELWNFIDTHGQCVLSLGSLADIEAGDKQLRLEIYDDYRE
mgnify:CR=1 FL=1